MAAIAHEIWNNIALVLADHYKHRYFTPELKAPYDNPMELLTVQKDVLQFFGTKPLNLFIIGKQFGWSIDDDGTWVEDWPPDEFDDSVAKHKDTFKQYAIYRTYIWTDFIIVDKIMEANPDSRFEEMMEAVHNHMIDLGTELADFGFTYLGKIEEEVEANFFYPYIDDFLKLQNDLEDV